MALVVVATFLSLTEAQIAAGALESGGIHPVVMDQGFGSVVWTEQFVLQGFRVAVIGSEADDAREYFSTLPKIRTRRPRLRIGGMLWRLLIAPALFAIGADLSWLMVGVLRQRRRGRAAELLMGTALAAALTAATVLGIAGPVLLAAILAAAIIRAAWPVLPLLAAIAIAVAVARLRRSNTQ
jgi:hypothetical protein